MGFASRYLLIVATVCYLTCVLADDCPPYWTKFQNHCYRFIGDAKPWKEAELHCRNIGASNGDAIAHLASIHSQEENSFLFHYWQSTRVAGCTNANNARLVDSVWIGFNDLGTEGNWIWSDGTDVDFDNWRPNEPNGATRENCGHFWNSDASNPYSGDMWNDTVCPALIPFICKMPAN